MKSISVIQCRLKGNAVIGKSTNEETGARLVVSVRSGIFSGTTSVSRPNVRLSITSFFRIDDTSVVILDTNSCTLFLRIDAASVVRLGANFAVTPFGRICISIVRLDANSSTLFFRIDATSVVRLDANFAVTPF